MTARRTRRYRLTPQPLLEDRLAPATFTATIDPAVDNVGAVAELAGFFRAANANGEDDTIALLPGRTYSFNVPAVQPGDFGRADGGTALPVIRGAQTVTIQGNGSSFVRPSGAPSLRFLRASGFINDAPVGSPTLVVSGLTFENGNVYDFGSGNLPNPDEFANLSGGAIRLDNADFVGIDLRFLNNTTADNGGAVAALDQEDFFASVSFTRSVFSANYAGKAGGAVSGVNKEPLIGSVVQFVNSTLTDNVSLTGGGAVDGVIYEVAFNTRDPATGLPTAGEGPNLVAANRGVVGGVRASLIDATNTLFTRNVGTAGAAAVFAFEQILRLRDSAIVNNQSLTSGAAVGMATGQAVELVNTTVHANLGGAPAVEAPLGQAVLAFSTVTNNASQNGSTAGVSVAQNILTVYASVVANNRVADPNSPVVDVAAPLVRNNGYNLFGVVPAGFQTVPTDLFGRPGAELNPLLGGVNGTAGLTFSDYVTQLPPVTFGTALTIDPLPVGTRLPVRVPAVGSPLLDRVRVEPPPRSPVPPATRLVPDARGLTAAGLPIAPRSADLIGSDVGAVEAQPGEAGLAIALPGPLIPPPPVVPPPPPPPGSVPPPPPGPTRPPAGFAAGPGAALNPFVPQPTAATPGARNEKADGTPEAADPGQTVPNAVRLFNPDGSVRLTVQPFPAAPPGGVRVALADLTGDGVPDLIAGTGPGVPNQVVVINGATGAVVASFSPFESSFTGGVFVAAGDLTGDGRAELVVSPDAGGGPRVRVFTVTAGALTPLADFFGIDDPNFRGGARVAVGDITGDGVGDLIVAAGTGGGPRIAVFDGTSLSGGTFTTKPFGDFFVFEPELRDGVFVAAGDVDADGRADLVIGAGPGGGPRVLVLSGRDLGGESPTRLADFFAGDESDRRGVTVAVADLDGDAAADVVTGSNTTGRIAAYFGTRLVGGSTTPDLLVQPFGEFQGGVFVG